MFESLPEVHRSVVREQHARIARRNAAVDIDYVPPRGEPTRGYGRLPYMTLRDVMYISAQVGQPTSDE